MSRILDLVDKYLVTKPTDYALLINGAWGSGKTFFFKNDIHKKITQHRLKPIYISLYGVNDTNDITKKIFFEVNSVLGSAAGKKLSEIAKVGLSALHLTTDHFRKKPG